MSSTPNDSIPAVYIHAADQDQEMQHYQPPSVGDAPTIHFDVSSPSAAAAAAPSPSSFSDQQANDGLLTVNDIAPQPITDPATGTLRFPCPHCDKSYRGKHARSIWRRHLQEKHAIPLAAQPRKTRWDNVADRPKTEAERRQRTLESKRRWARKNRANQKAKKLGIDVSQLPEYEEEQRAVRAPPAQLRMPPAPAPIPANFFRPSSSASSFNSSFSGDDLPLNLPPTPTQMYPALAKLAPPHHPPLGMHKSLSNPLPLPFQHQQPAAVDTTYIVPPPMPADVVVYSPALSEAASDYGQYAPASTADLLQPHTVVLPSPEMASWSLPLPLPPTALQPHQPLQPPQLLSLPEHAALMQRRVSAPDSFQDASSLQRAPAVAFEPTEQAAERLLQLRMPSSSAPNSPEREVYPRQRHGGPLFGHANMDLDDRPDTSLAHTLPQLLPFNFATDIECAMSDAPGPFDAGMPSSPPDLYHAGQHAYGGSESSSGVSTPPPPVQPAYTFGGAGPGPMMHPADFAHLLGSSPPALSSPGHPDISVELGLAPDALTMGGRKREQTIVPTSSPGQWRIHYPQPPKWHAGPTA